MGILSQVRPDRQMLMFSATWPEGVQKLARQHCKEDPVLVRIGGDRLAACRTINQKVLVLGTEFKFQKLHEAICRTGCNIRGNAHKCMVFCKTKASGLHSDKTQEQRIYVLDQFKNGEVSCLIGTDCMGRGHDIPRVKYVINYDAPDQIEHYVHRIGRTGRAGEQGFAVTFLTEQDHQIAEKLVGVLRETVQKVPKELDSLVNDHRSGPRSFPQEVPSGTPLDL